jgi:hypothetical protein
LKIEHYGLKWKIKVFFKSLTPLFKNGHFFLSIFKNRPKDLKKSFIIHFFSSALPISRGYLYGLEIFLSFIGTWALSSQRKFGWDYSKNGGEIWEVYFSKQRVRFFGDVLNNWLPRKSDLSPKNREVCF